MAVAQTQLGGDINGEAASDNSGSWVTLSADGNRIAIGADHNDGNGFSSGHVRVFGLVGGAWTQVGADIDGEAAGDISGYSVALSGDGNRVAIGAPNNGGNGGLSGHVRVYDLVGGAWTQVGADIDGEAADDRSGWSVALSADGNRVAGGAVGNDEKFYNSGHVRVYALGGPEFSCTEFAPPMSHYPVTVKKNRALPLKAQVYDAEGYLLTDADFAAPPVLQVLFFSGNAGNPVDVTNDALSAGKGTDGNQFVFTDDDYWQFNLKTKNYSAPGNYVVQMESGDDSEYVFKPTCETVFVVE